MREELLLASFQGFLKVGSFRKRHWGGGLKTTLTHKVQTCFGPKYAWWNPMGPWWPEGNPGWLSNRDPDFILFILLIPDDIKMGNISFPAKNNPTNGKKGAPFFHCSIPCWNDRRSSFGSPGCKTRLWNVGRNGCVCRDVGPVQMGRSKKKPRGFSEWENN